MFHKTLCTAGLVVIFISVSLCLLLLTETLQIDLSRKIIGKKYPFSNIQNHSRISVCMMVPVTSRGIRHNVSIGLQLLDLPLIHTFIPSLLETIESEYNYRLYIGFDDGDPWFDNEVNLHNLFSFIHDIINNSNRSEVHVYVTPITLFGVDKRITAIWNLLATAAYKDMCDYFYPGNDDIRLLTKNWTSAAIHTLQSCSVARNFGIVAFRDLNNCLMPTFHLVHRTHLDLHNKIYYPLPFHGDAQDPWIFGVYQHWNCAFFLKHYELKNHIGLLSGTRYPGTNANLIRDYIIRGRHRLYSRLSNITNSHYNQSFVNRNSLHLNVNYLVPC